MVGWRNSLPECGNLHVVILLVPLRSPHTVHSGSALLASLSPGSMLRVRTPIQANSTRLSDTISYVRIF